MMKMMTLMMMMILIMMILMIYEGKELARIINLYVWPERVCKAETLTGGYYFHISSFKQHDI